MSYQETKELPLSTDLIQLISNFKKADNIHTDTISDLIIHICEIFHIDRAYTARRLDTHRTAIVPVMSYEINTKPFYFDPDIDALTSEYTMQEVEENERLCFNMSMEKRLFSTEDIKQNKDILKNVNYQIKANKTVNEMLFYCVHLDHLFGYIAFERFAGSPNFTHDELFFLDTVFEILGTKVNEIVSKINSENQKKIKEAIVNNEQMPVCLVEKDTHAILYFNEFFQKIVPTVKVGMSYYDLYKKMQNSKMDSSELLRLQQDAKIKYWLKKSVPLTLDDTEMYLVYAKDTEDYIKQLEGIDLLTSTFSATGFCDYYNQMYQNCNTTYYVCTMDIDKFKYINYSLGFSIGNQLLKNIADVIDHFLGATEISCRMNGDGFAFIVQCNSRDEVTEKINGLFEKLDEMQLEFFSEIKMKFTCGVKKVEPQYTINRLLDYANLARKHIKGYHENTISFFDKSITEREKSELKLEQRIATAVENDEFKLFLQPKFNLETKEICGAEALVRWISKDGMIVPDRFIPLFEKDGFINTLDFIMYKKVMGHIRETLDQGFTVYPISLNVSRSHIQNKNFIHQFTELINEYNVPVELIELEVTESMFVEDRETLISFIEDIKQLGITVSIDDFGTAYSSLQVLKDVYVDTLKIDKGFLDSIDLQDSFHASRDKIVLKNIINLATELGCKVICEGVETKDQVDMLLGIGCKYGQGYIFAKPMPIVDYIRKFLSEETYQSPNAI